MPLVDFHNSYSMKINVTDDALQLASKSCDKVVTRLLAVLFHEVLMKPCDKQLIQSSAEKTMRHT